jgi:hypothetical protein
MGASEERCRFDIDIRSCMKFKDITLEDTQIEDEGLTPRYALRQELLEEGVVTEEGDIPNTQTGDPKVFFEEDFRKRREIVDQDLDFVKKNWLAFTDAQLAEILGIGASYVRDIRAKLGLKRDAEARKIAKYSPPFFVIMPRMYYDDFEHDITELGISEFMYGEERKPYNPKRITRSKL